MRERFARVSNEFHIDWDQSRGVLRVHVEDNVLEFERRGNLYICDMRELVRPVAAMIQTVTGNCTPKGKYATPRKLGG